MIEYRADPERYLILGPPSPCFAPSSYIASPKDESEIEDADLLHPRSSRTSSTSSAGLLPQQRNNSNAHQHQYQHQRQRQHQRRDAHAKGSSVQLSSSEERKHSIPDLTVAESRWVASERCWVYKLRRSVDGTVYVSHDGNEWFVEDDVIGSASAAAA